MLLLNVVLALAWLMLTGVATPVNFTFGLLVGFGILRFSRYQGNERYFRKPFQVVAFFLYFLKELIKANLRVAFDVLTPKDYMEPAIVAIPLDVKTEAQITLLANCITLTPGTLSLDVSGDRSTLYIHAMYSHAGDLDAVRREIKDGFERRILELFS